MKNLFSFKLPSQWVTFPMIYRGDQIIAEVSNWTLKTKIWVNDEIVEKKQISRVQTVDKEKFSETRRFKLPSGEEVSLTVGCSLSDGMLFCSAEADGTIFYEKSFSEDAPASPEKEDSLLLIIPAAAIGGLLGYFVTQLILGGL